MIKNEVAKYIENKKGKDINISEMMEMQKELWEIHKDKWSPMEAKYGRNFLLWMIEEMGELAKEV